MAVTRAQLESVLIVRAGAWLNYVSLDGTTHAGANASLSDPITQALLQSGYTVADITNVADSDLTSVPATAYAQILDIAELRTLETILQAFVDFDTKGLNYEDKDDQFGQRIEKAIARKRKAVQDRYGIDAASIQTGLIDLNFQTQNDTIINY